MSSNTLNSFESNLSKSTAVETRELLAAIGLVVDQTGNTLYNFASGPQSLAPDASNLSENSTITLGSAGKFITHIAALQCVDRGLISLDESVYPHVPELEKLHIISENKDPGSSPLPYTLTPPTTPITLRQLLTHTSGIDGDEDIPLVSQWRANNPKSEDMSINPIVRSCSTPLKFEPGKGWCYGSSIAWTQLLVERISQQTIGRFVQEHVFDILGMSSSTYKPEEQPEIAGKVLQMVQRRGDQLVPADGHVRGLVMSVRDIGVLLGDLMAPTSKILKKGSVDELFKQQLTNEALGDLQGDTENYAAPAGIPASLTVAPVNFTCAGLFVEGELPLSQMPFGTVTWNGMPNVIWAMNKEKGVALLFATQLLPVDDEKTVDLAMEFMRGAWERFGSVGK